MCCEMRFKSKIIFLEVLRHFQTHFKDVLVTVGMFITAVDMPPTQVSVVLYLVLQVCSSF